MIKLPCGVDLNDLIDDLRNLSWEVSDILLHYANIIKNSEQKKDFLKNKNNDDPVTLADLEVNELIIYRINEKYKDINWTILSEENVKVEANYSEIKHDWVWVLDPLDGTKDFIQGTGNYAMHLALTFKKKSLLGVVLIPEKNELWISNGEKLWCEKKDGSLKKFNKSKNNKILNEMILVTSKNHNNEVLKRVIEKINFKKVVVMGSVGCKITSLLRGESDIYISLSLPGKSAPKDWDFAAPEAILKAGGGAITNLDIKDLIYMKSNFEQKGIIIASNNKQTHGKVCSQIEEIIAMNALYPFS